MLLHRLTPLALALTGALVLASPARGEELPDLMAPADVTRRIENAQQLEKKDVVSLARALAALGGSKTEDPNAVEFLVEYAVREEGRVLRLLAIDAARRLDTKRAAQLFKERATGEDRLKTVHALHGLGYTGGKDDLDRVIELAQAKSEMIAVQACRALAQLPSKKRVTEMIELGLDHPKPHVGDHAAWAVQDQLKKNKVVLGKYAKYAKSKKDEDRAIRAESTIALLEDKLAQVHKWEDGGAELRKLLADMPESMPIDALKPEYKEKIEAMLGWLEENVPAQWLLIRLAVKKIVCKGDVVVSHLLVDTDSVNIPLNYIVQRPGKLAYHVALHSGPLLQKRIGQPWKGHRGWEPSIFDMYDLSVEAKLWDVGPGKVTRRAFIEDRLASRPWGGD